MVFVNCTHHPSHNWLSDQLCAARAYGDIIEMPFPSVLPSFDADDVHKMACDLLDSFVAIASKNGCATVHLMGEQTLCGAVMREYERRCWGESEGASTAAPVYNDKLRFVVTSSRRVSWMDGNQRRHDWQFASFREVK